MAENSPAFQRRDQVMSALSPEGTAEPGCLSRPFGTHSSRPSNPALKRRAILICPSGTPRASLASNPSGVGQALRSAVTACFFLGFGMVTEAAKVDFNRDIRPVMTDTCFRCHGFDAKARKARLRLDLREEALKPAKSGATPIVPGQPEKSEAIRRIFTQDEDDRMPPAEIHRVLTANEK